MKVSFSKPQKQLVPYIDALWVFESGSGLPAADSRIIVPDGRPKILIPYKNPVSVVIENSPIYTREHQIFLIGIQTSARTICSPAMDTGTIGVELTPKGLYHFFKLRMSDIADRIYSFEDLFGPWGARLQNRLGSLEQPDQMIALVQRALIQLLHRNMTDFSLLNHAVDLITHSHGMIKIHELATHTGYSRRYLDRLFKEYVGTSPKSLASIMRFQNIYHVWTQEKSAAFFSDELYASYYDQAHFIKEFKHFTGYTPRKYAELGHEFARAFSQP